MSEPIHHPVDFLHRGPMAPSNLHFSPLEVTAVDDTKLINGTSAKDIFKLGEARQCARSAERCGRWLGRFQKLASPSGRTSGIERFLSSAERKCRLICEAERGWALQCEDLLERLRNSAVSLDAGLTCAGHGDFCEHQIVLTKGQTDVLDWDLYDIAHPARDVAKFIVSLDRKSVV